MSKCFPELIVVSTAVFVLALPAGAQTNPDTSRQRSNESVPTCVPTTTTTPDTTPPVTTLTVYNPAMASIPQLTFYAPYTPDAVAPLLTFYTPLGQIDPPMRVSTTLSSLPGQTVQTARAVPMQSSMTTQTIPSPGPCPPGTQVERPVR